MSTVVSVVVGVAKFLTSGTIYSAAANAAISIGVSTIQRRRQKKRAAAAARQAAKQQRAAQRRLLLQQRRARTVDFEIPFVAQQPLTQMIRHPIANRRLVFGRSRLGGIWVFYEKTGVSNEFRHVVLTICEGPIDAIEAVYFDEEEVPISGSPTYDGSNVLLDNVTGTYAGNARITTHLGDETTLAETVTFSASPNFDAPAHGFQDGDRIQLATSGTLPTGLSASTDYWVINATANDFEVTTDRGSTTAETFTVDDTGTHTATRFVADFDTASDCTNWTNDHKLLGIAYICVRLRNNPDLYPGLIPNISVRIRGASNIDLDDGTTGYTTNAALCLAHYLRMEDYGPGVPETGIDPDELSNSKQICDENVGLATSGNFTTDFGSDPSQLDSTGHGRSNGDILFLEGSDLPAPLAEDTAYFVVNATTDALELATSEGGTPITMTDDGTPTHTWRLTEKRYSVNGVVDLGLDVEDNRGALAQAMAGDITRSNGYWRIMAGAYVTPTFEITESMLVGEFKLRTETPRRDRVNLIRGNFFDPDSNYQPTSFPAVTNSVYVAEDGGEEIMQQVQLQFTQSAAAAQRIAKIFLEENRRSDSLSLRCSLVAFPAQVGKTVLVTISRYEFVQRPFEVLDASFSVLDGRPTVDLELRAIDPAVFAWIHTEEQAQNVPASLINPGTKVATITSSPTGGSGYSFPLAVTLSTSTTGAAIRYVVNGSGAPQTIGSGTEYTAALSLSDGDTVDAKAFKDGFEASDDFSATFTS